MNLHNQIMNIQIVSKVKQEYEDNRGRPVGGWYSYREGHRDARHVAAELSLKAEARIEELEEVLKFVINSYLNSTVDQAASNLYKCWQKARETLENK